MAKLIARLAAAGAISALLTMQTGSGVASDVVETAPLGPVWVPVSRFRPSNRACAKYEPSAFSGSILGESEVSVVGALKGGADALDELCRWQQPSGLNHSALGVHPFGLNGIQPRTLDRQKA